MTKPKELEEKANPNASEEKDGRWKIPARDGIEVFINNGGSISIQVTSYADETTVAVAVDQVDELVHYLQEAKAELMQQQAEQSAKRG